MSTLAEAHCVVAALQLRHAGQEVAHARNLHGRAWTAGSVDSSRVLKDGSDSRVHRSTCSLTFPKYVLSVSAKAPSPVAMLCTKTPVEHRRSADADQQDLGWSLD